MKLDVVKRILDEEDIDEAVLVTESIKNAVELHVLANNYNWDNGFRVPEAIIRNECCDLGTALLMFYLADGYSMLSDRENFGNSTLSDWKKFLEELLGKITRREFLRSEIAFSVPLTKVQLFKLKKGNKNIPDILINELKGEFVEVPIL